MADFRNGLPKGFVLAKPIKQEEYDESIIYDLEKQGRLIITRKRDGWKLLAHFDAKGTIRLYTDGINEVDSRLDHIKEELRLVGVPVNTLIVGEAIVDIASNDDLTKVQSIFGSNLSKAMDIQKEHGKVRFMVFGVVPLSKENSYSTIDFRLAYMSCELSRPVPRFKYVFQVPIIAANFTKAKEIVVKRNWEGLVLYADDYQLTYRTDGKNPARPKGCYKWKPIMEDDFIVREWLPRPDKTLKEIVLSQIDPVTKKEFYCGKLGSFNDNMRHELRFLNYPVVVQARFDTRYSKTGKIRNPRFMRIRDDKKIEDCVAPKHYGSD